MSQPGGIAHGGRWNTTSHTPADLVPLNCGGCGRPLDGGDDSTLFVCVSCGLVHEPVEDGLASFPAMVAEVTTELAVPSDVRYLAVWRFGAPEWERIARLADTGECFVYVPAFSLMRPVVQRLGAGLCLNQPELELTAGFPLQVRSRPSLVGGAEQPWASWDGPGFGAVSPVVAGRDDAQVLAQFVKTAVESQETRGRATPVEATKLESGELVFLPAVWDPRYIHESNWRLLLSEFDDLVA